MQTQFWFHIIRKRAKQIKKQARKEKIIFNFIETNLYIIFVFIGALNCFFFTKCIIMQQVILKANLWQNRNMYISYFFLLKVFFSNSRLGLFLEHLLAFWIQGSSFSLLIFPAGSSKAMPMSGLQWDS